MAATIPTNGIGLDAGLDVTGGDITFKTADKGVNLGVTSAAATNQLHDYEEGTYAYTITGSTSGSYGARSGYTRANYAKVGNVCHVSIRYETDTDNSLSGNLYFSLPFTAADPNGSDSDAWVAPGYVRDNSYGTNARPGVYYCGQNTA